ncbi:MAG: hypothetical protein RLY43_705 [Bacteroidota bacterium]
MDKIIQKLDFLKSTRFWKIVIAITLESLVTYGVIDTVSAEMVAHIISVTLGLSVTVRTVDRFSEKIGTKN